MNKDIPEIVEPIGAKDCTALSLIKVAYSQTGVLYDVDTLWNATPKNQFGAVPIDTIKTAINQGLFNPKTGLTDKLWDNWMTPKDIQKDMEVCQSACMIDGYWYQEWNGLAPNTILSHGKNVITGHSYIVKDWQNGVAVIDAHLGYDLLMPLDILTEEVDGVGCSAYIPTNKIINMRRQISILQMLIELWQKLILAFSTTNTPQGGIIQPMQSTVQNFCEAIADYEGGPNDLNHRNNNPGNCVYNIDGYLPKYGDVKQNGRFAVFPTWDLGFLYLTNLVKQHIFAHPNWTIFDFFAQFYSPSSDGNDPLKYATFVAKRVDLTTGDLISKLT